MYNSIIEELENKKICILGFGKEGKSTYNFIRRHLNDKHITIIDKNDISNCNEIIGDKNIDIIWGED